MLLFAYAGVRDLGPKGKNLEQKFKKNVFLGGNMEVSKKAVALRIARLNHSCQPNAATIYDETARVAILFALKDIQLGEEISISYYSRLFALGSARLSSSNPELSLGEEFIYLKNQILSGYRITCPDNCSCKIQFFVFSSTKQDRSTRPL